MTEAGESKKLRLPRLLGALRARDWTGIAIEIAIVMLGVLLAFQVQQWGEERARATEERKFLERLHGEYRRGIAELERVNQSHVTVMRDIRAVFDARDDPVRLETYRRTNDFGCGTARFQSAPFNDTASEELIASGRLNLIADERLRGEIRDLATAQAGAFKQVTYGRELMLNQLGSLNPYYQFDMGSKGGPTCRIKWADALKDPLAVNALLRAYRVHQLTLIERQKVKNQIEAVMATIGCKLGEGECRQ